jgi:hypothetical protein
MMKKLYLLLFLLIFAFGGCDSGSSSGGGGGGLNMNGNWSGQWSAEVQAGQSAVAISGGPLRVSLQLNGKQLTGTVEPTNLLGDQSGYFSATISNPGGPGNIEVGTMYNSTISVSFHGTYNNSQIFCIFGSSASTESIVKGNFTITK